MNHVGFGKIWESNWKCRELTIAEQPTACPQGSQAEPFRIAHRKHQDQYGRWRAADSKCWTRQAARIGDTWTANAASHLRSVAMKPQGGDATEKKAFGRLFQRIAYVFRPSYPFASYNCDKTLPSRRFGLSFSRARFQSRTRMRNKFSCGLSNWLWL